MRQQVSETREVDNSFLLEFGCHPDESRLILSCRWSGGNAQAEYRPPPSVPQDDCSPRERAESFGTDLYKALFPGPIRAELRRAKEAYPDELIIRLSIPAELNDREELETIPWEYAYDRDNDEFLSLSRRFILVRDLGRIEKIFPLRGSPPIRILVVWADPDPSNSVNPELEVETIRRAWGDRARIYELPRATFAEFCERVRELSALDRLHVVHFIGHTSSTSSQELVFHSPDGTRASVTASKFATQLEGHPDLRLVVLNACSTATPPTGWTHDPSRSLAYALLKRGIPTVVATRLPIDNTSAVTLANGFYAALSRGQSLETAAVEAKRRIAEGDAEAGDSLFRWGIPVLYSQIRGQVFEFSRPDSIEKLNLGIYTTDHAFIGQSPPLTLDLQQDFRGRKLAPGRKWEVVRDQVYGFLRAHVRLTQEVDLHLIAFLSVSFAAGYCIGSTGCPITLVQVNRRTGTTERWRPSPHPPKREESTWHIEFLEEAGGADLVIAIEVSQPNVGSDVQAAWSKLAEGPASFLHASLPASNNAICDADHAFNLAEALIAEIKKLQKGRKVHLFMATPATFAFYLGQLSGFLGEIQLYEHDPEEETKYSASIKVSPSDRLRPPR